MRINWAWFLQIKGQGIYAYVTLVEQAEPSDAIKNQMKQVNPAMHVRIYVFKRYEAGKSGYIFTCWEIYGVTNNKSMYGCEAFSIYIHGC